MTASDDPHDGFFGESVAAAYDSEDSSRFSSTHLDEVASFLAGLAGDGPALEFAIGTGRIAVPLAERGVPVHGIDLSRAMVERLHTRAPDIPVTIGDFSSARVPGTFAVVYLVFNTIGNLTTQEAQVACFANAAAHLRPGGAFVIETGVPPLRDLPPGRSVVPLDAGPGVWAYDTVDTSTQFLSSTYVRVDEASGRGSVRTIPFRYTWPAELDLMARLAVLTPASRHQDWVGTPFTHESREHVSVWRKHA
jgi:SAM-dependent methyltransferase